MTPAAYPTPAAHGIGALVPLLTTLLVLLVGSCQPPGPACTTTADCGEKQACIEEECEDVECLASAECPIEAYCHPETYTCEAGCLSSDDCLTGDRCDVLTSTCVPRSCQATQIDCELGERCNLQTGECERDPEPHCEPCNFPDECGPTGICAALTERGRGYCFLQCSPEAFDPCPAGLQCSFQQTGPDGDGEFHCVGLCDRF